MSEVIYTESCHAGLLCMALNLGNSFGSSLSVGVYRIKLNNLTKYVELPVECLRTRVQFPPPPPIIPPTGFNAVLVTAFLFFVNLAVSDGLDGASVMADNTDELIDVLLGDVHGFFDDDPLHALCARWCGE